MPQPVFRGNISRGGSETLLLRIPQESDIVVSAGSQTTLPARALCQLQQLLLTSLDLRVSHIETIPSAPTRGPVTTKFSHRRSHRPRHQQVFARRARDEIVKPSIQQQQSLPHRVFSSKRQPQQPSWTPKSRHTVSLNIKNMSLFSTSVCARPRASVEPAQLKVLGSVAMENPTLSPKSPLRSPRKRDGGRAPPPRAQRRLPVQVGMRCVLCAILNGLAG